jgi:hypothetical protein
LLILKFDTVRLIFFSSSNGIFMITPHAEA